MGMDVDHGLGNVHLTLVPSDPAIYTIWEVAGPIVVGQEITDLASRNLPI
jgi:hypothetical protein